MKKYQTTILLCVGFATCLLSCGKPATSGSVSERISVEAAFNNPQKLKASDYFHKIRYIPLETTDSCLLGRNPRIEIAHDKLVITTSQNQCYLFDKESGRFLGSVGRIGNGPGESPSLQGWLNNPAGRIYFPIEKGGFVMYSLDGNFVGDLKTSFLSDGFSLTKYNYLDASTLLAHCPGTAEQPDCVALFQDTTVLNRFNTNGSNLNSEALNPANIESISVETKSLGGSTFIQIRYKDGKESGASMISGNPFWHVGGKVYFKESFNDTIYQVKTDGLHFARVFDFGSLRWDAADRNNTEKDQAIYPIDIYENKDIILFRFVVNLYHAEKRIPYNGIFNKSTSEVKVSQYDNEIENDMSHFLPLQPTYMSPCGELAQLIPAEKIATWFEEHPDTSTLPEAVKALKRVGEEENPVVVIVE